MALFLHARPFFLFCFYSPTEREGASEGGDEVRFGQAQRQGHSTDWKCSEVDDRCQGLTWSVLGTE